MPDKILFGPFTKGVDNQTTDTRLPEGAVRDAVNVDFDNTGNAMRRAGFARKVSSSSLHSLWTSEEQGISYVMDAAVLKRVRVAADGSVSLSTLGTMPNAMPVSYTDLNGKVVFGNRGYLYAATADGEVGPLGVENPGSFQVSAGTGGGLPAGRYGVALSYIHSNMTEGGVGEAQFVTVPEGGSIALVLPTAIEAETAGIQVYRTPANGDVFYRCGLAPAAGGPWTIGEGPLGRAADNRFKVRMLGGDIVRAWKGRLLVARGSTVWFSEPLQYGLTAEARNFVSAASTIRVLEPVEGGVYVGTETGVWFLSGADPTTWGLILLSGKPPLAGSGFRVRPALLNPEQAQEPGTLYVGWFAVNGIVLGSPSGRLIEPHDGQLLIPASQIENSRARTLVNERERRVVTTLQ